MNKGRQEGIFVCNIIEVSVFGPLPLYQLWAVDALGPSLKSDNRMMVITSAGDYWQAKKNMPETNYGHQSFSNYL